MSNDSRKLQLIGVGVAAIGVGALAYASRAGWLTRSVASGHKSPVEGAIRVGIVGTGWGVNVQLPQFRHEGLDVTAICSRSMDRAITLAAEHKIANPFADVKALCESPEVDLVSIVTPCYQHAEHFITAMEAGKHVLVDKPLCLTGEEGERMLAVSRAHPDQVVVVDHEMRFTPALQNARQLLRDGVVGEVRAVEVVVALPAAKPDKAFTWWNDKDKGGGGLGAIGSHIVDALRFLTDGEVASVAAHLRTVVPTYRDEESGQQQEATADDYSSMQLRLEPGMTSKGKPFWGPAGNINAHVTVSLAGGDGMAQMFSVLGSAGSSTFDFSTSSLDVSVGGKPHPTSLKGIGSAFAVDGTRGLAAALQRALGPHKDRAALAVGATLEDGLAEQYVLDAARLSSELEGAWVTPKRVSEPPSAPKGGGSATPPRSPRVSAAVRQLESNSS